MPEILFVCTANQFRSPIASAYFQKKLIESGRTGNWAISSAGTWTKNGLPACNEAKNAASRIGLDISRHSTREVNAAILSAADLIVTMEQGHKEALTAEFPQCKDRIILLCQAAGEPVTEIADPVFTNFQFCEMTVLSIVFCIDRSFNKLMNLAEFFHRDHENIVKNTQHQKE